VPIPKPTDVRTKAMTCNDIAISPAISKVFEYCFLDKFQSLLTKKVVAVMPSIPFEKLLIVTYILAGCTMNICAIDLSKAFDKVNYDVVGDL